MCSSDLTLHQFFDAAKKTTLKLVLELKTLNSPERETEAVKKILAMVNEYGFNDRMEYISFSKFAVEEFIRLAPKGTPVYILSAKYDPQQIKAMGCAGPDYSFKTFVQHPQWIKECQNLGMKVNVWTVNKQADMEWCINHGVNFITTDQPVELMKLLKK